MWSLWPFRLAHLQRSKSRHEDLTDWARDYIQNSPPLVQGCFCTSACCDSCRSFYEANRNGDAIAPLSDQVLRGRELASEDDLVGTRMVLKELSHDNHQLIKGEMLRRWLHDQKFFDIGARPVHADMTAGSCVSGEDAERPCSPSTRGGSCATSAANTSCWLKFRRSSGSIACLMAEVERRAALPRSRYFCSCARCTLAPSHSTSHPPPPPPPSLSHLASRTSPATAPSHAGLELPALHTPALCVCVCVCCG